MCRGVEGEGGACTDTGCEQVWLQVEMSHFHGRVGGWVYEISPPSDTNMPLADATRSSPRDLTMVPQAPCCFKATLASTRVLMVSR